MKRSRYLFTLLALLLMSMTAYAQEKVYSGVVVDNTDEPVIGATIVQKGTQVRTITDMDGVFKITASPGATLVISYVGCKTQEVKVKDNMRVVLEDDTQMLNDVVVIGYGTQKKSVVTASIAKVSSEDLAGKTPVRVDNALKGLAAGVNVTSSSGQPGAAPKVRIRGTGTINNSDPLYVVDGMPIEGGIDFVNPGDIESIEVLKDAASGAIYGARAANGVVLVTTKRGKTGKAQINYNFSYGWASKTRKRDVTSATDYAILQNERNVNGGLAPVYADPYNLTDTNGNKITGFGTDWQDLVFNDNAPVMNHDVSISGATEKVNYFLSMGYFEQEGIVGGNYGHSNYDRLTLRSNTTYNVWDASKERKFLNKLDLNVNLAYMRTHSTSISENSEYGSVLGSALYMAPTLAPVATGDVATAMNDYYTSMGYEIAKDGNGNPYSVPMYFGSFNEQNNPLAMLALNPKRYWSHKFVPKFSFDLTLWDNLKYHFSYSADLSFWGNEDATTTKFYLSNNNKSDHTSASKGSYKGTVWQIENTLTYDKTIDKHSFGVVLGQSAFKNKSDNLWGEKWNLVNPAKPSIDYSTGQVVDGVAQFSVTGGNNVEHRLSSLFARFSYNYDERYMLQATVRRDGSSRFGSNNKYGTFPSVSVGWNIINEKFMENTRSWLSNLKFRASWGKNGNDNIGDFLYTAMTVMGNNVLFGENAIKTNGSKANGLPNPDIKWEESEQTDLGLDFGFFNNALTFTVDYYIKKTNGMLMTMPIPSYVGEIKPTGNIGDMENSGIEFELGYKWNIADAKFAVKGNATYLHNELTYIGLEDNAYVEFSDGVQGISGGTIARGMRGEPFPFFYGMKTNGIFQNYDEINAYTHTDGTLIMPDARPGDVRFVDVNHDGKIDSGDRTNIGNGTPKWTFGFNFDAEWKGFDFNIFLQGVTGVDVFDATYRTDITSGNFPTWMLGRWTGEGTSNKYPILRAGDETYNWSASDLYVHDGSYLRIKNLSLGYTLPKNITRRLAIERFRVYVMAENLVTWTKYWGYDPEIASGPDNSRSLGIDRGVYPQARTWTIGCNITF